MDTSLVEIHSEDVQDFDRCIKVLAGPGAGKTYWLIGQIKHILYDAKDLGLTRKVACITYTNKATENIFSKIGYNNERLEVSTIHAFLYKNIIEPYFHLIAEEEGFAIDKLDGHDDTIKSNYSFVYNLLTSNHMGQLISDCVNEIFKLKKTVEDYRWSLTDNGIELIKSITYPRLAGIGLQYVKAYKKAVWHDFGLMHHDDLLYFTYKLLVKYPRILNLLVARYPYLLIDEYQDSSSIQHWLFTQLANKGCKVTLIGDQAQSIYTFAGADMKNIVNFTAPYMRSYEIKDNHRSVQNIVDFLNVLRPQFSQNSLRKDNYEKVNLICGDNIDAYNIASKVCGCEDLYTLTWKNEDANTMKFGLEVNNDSNNLIEHLDEEDRGGGRARGRSISYLVKGVENARQLLMDDAVKFIAKGFDLDTKDIEQKKQTIINLNKLLKSYYDYSSGRLLDFLIQVRAIDESLKMVKRGKVFDIYNKPYIDYAKSVNYTEDNTHFITIHKSKGLGFDNVMLVFPDKEIAIDFLLNTNLNKSDDDHRTYYVACSRASNRLFINCPLLSNDEKQLLEKKYGEILNIIDVF